MIRKTAKIKNPAGLILQSAGQLCEEADRFSSSISIYKGQVMTNAKSLLSVLGACIKYGDEVEFICDGEDEEEAMAAMLKLVTEPF